jgi:hypothetical protein
LQVERESSLICERAVFQFLLAQSEETEMAKKPTPKDIDPLLKQFGELLNTLKPRIETQASEMGLSVHLRFSADQIEKASMRKLASLVADAVA